MKKRILLLLSVVAVMVVMLAASAMPAFAISQTGINNACEHAGGQDGPKGGPHEGTNPVWFCIA